MEINEVLWDWALVLELRGTLDVNTSPAAQEKLLSLIERGYIHLALDLSRLDYVSSAGLRVLLLVLKKLRSCNGKVILFGFTDYLKRIFDIVGFTALFVIAPSLEEALRAFRWKHPLGQFVRTPRRGPNLGAYSGETIDIDALEGDIISAGEQHDFRCERLLDEAGCRLIALSRVSPSASKAIYLSSGIHGDEPAPPLAIANLLWQNQWPADWNIYLCHCLNPEGFRANRRTNAMDIDLNRDYCESKSREICAHVAWLQQQPSFSVTASLHEDWEALGFYVYQLGPLSVEPVIDHILHEVAEVCPIDDSSTIDHLPAEEGVLDLAFHSLQVNEASIDRLGDPITGGLAPRPSSIWSEPIFLVNRKTRVSYTFESASALPIEVRVGALTRAVIALLSCSHEIY